MSRAKLLKIGILIACRSCPPPAGDISSNLSTISTEKVIACYMTNHFSIEIGIGYITGQLVQLVRNLGYIILVDYVIVYIPV